MRMRCVAQGTRVHTHALHPAEREARTTMLARARTDVCALPATDM